ncbi:Uncharacterised protein [Mycobacteroides abscessus subsp. massiliense]|nr:Uncharacterised protein [Mycobacteroides abscessus subsp. massiliense]SKH33848.1 Uncharacterised protein [Mycobacteroides abscessus subsp. massiliense]SKH43014.1 Uncharacterised protein [Mycobacteroides abscessus subsp. massiliense]SKH43166.1 Uncharacterised protein [Mycobacteroides abscessus subsp. massiliense]SKH90252.1 Uncharacterised protein [Mycobacteroides abscessus subsp. massiliense]
MPNARHQGRFAYAASIASMLAVLGLTNQTSPGIAQVSANVRITCQEVSAVGDCESKTPEEDNNRGDCAEINALGSCENQEQVEDPPHTMAR